MLLRMLRLIVLVLMISGCILGQSDVTPDKLIGETVILTLESGAFPDSSITIQFLSSKDLVWRLDGNLGEQTGSSDYLISMVNNETMLITWRDEDSTLSYIVTMNFGVERCFLVRVDQGNNLLSEGVFAFQ